MPRARHKATAELFSWLLNPPNDLCCQVSQTRLHNEWIQQVTGHLLDNQYPAYHKVHIIWKQKLSEHIQKSDCSSSNLKTCNFMFEEDWERKKLNESKRQASERQNTWQQVEHANLHSDLLQNWKREPWIALDISRGDLHCCICGTSHVQLWWWNKIHQTTS